MTGGTPDVTPLPGAEVPATTPIDLQVVVEPELAEEPILDAAWLDLEPFLDAEAGPAGPTCAHATDDGQDPDAIELPPPDEPWAQLAPGYAARIAPLEGPSMTSRAVPAYSPETDGELEIRNVAGDALRPVPAPTASTRPKQDEWGLYDPEQCGFAALLQRLDELANDDRRERERGNRSGIMRP